VGGAVDTVGDVILSLRESVEQETAAIMFDGSKYSVNEISVEGESTEETTVPAVSNFSLFSAMSCEKLLY